MLSLTAVLSLSLLPIISVNGAAINKIQARANGIQWSPCPKELNALDSSNRTFQCGTLEVPLDYSNKSSTATLSLNLIKAPAVNQPKLGSILMNFGGPGGDGLVNLASSASIFQPITGGYHDLISWDPRGTGTTLTFNCYPNATERALASLTLRNEFANASDTALGRTWAEAGIFAATCEQAANATVGMVGTAFTVRDMFQIVDNLGEDGKLRYMGISYGTTLGAVALAMFPDRIDRAVLDGVQNPHEYYHTFGDPEMYTETDATWQAFISGCMKAPDNCALAKHASSAADLSEKLDRLIDDIKYNPLALGSAVIDYTIVKSVIVSTLYWTNQYADLATQLELVLTKNITGLASLLATAGNTTSSSAANDALQGIKCGDKFLRTTDVEDIRAELYGSLYKTSARFGDYPTVPMTTCAQWPFEAKERYSGDFHVKTSYPPLIVGSPIDPVTPIKSAYNISQGFEGSVVLQHNGAGHTSISQPSTCTAGHIAQYFINGTLPAPNTVCQPDKPLFAPN